MSNNDSSVTVLPLMTPAEVALAFHVDPKTVTRWAKQGRLNFLWTPGGHRRYYADEVRVLLARGQAGEKL